MSTMVPGYQHWRGQSTGIWTRRWTITRYGLRLCWRSRLLKILFAVVWVSALGLVALHFMVGQVLSPDSALLSYFTQNFGRRAKAVIDGMAAWILLYPEISVDGLYRFTLSYASLFYGTLCFYAVALFVPKLISHDLSSRAILVYNSKALTRFDYLLGKFGIVATLVAALAVAPLVMIWFLGNLLSPDWSFFWYGLPALGRALAVGGVTTVSLSLFALAVSSLAKKTSSATAFWILAWVVSGFAASAASKVFSWGRYLSPGVCLREISHRVYAVSDVVETAKESLPFFKSTLESMPRKTSILEATPEQGWWVPCLFLAGFCVLALLAISKRVQPE